MFESMRGKKTDNHGQVLREHGRLRKGLLDDPIFAVYRRSSHVIAGQEPTLNFSRFIHSRRKARLDLRVSPANYIGSLIATLSLLVPELLSC